MGRPAPRPHPTSTGANMGMGRILMALLPVVLAMLAKRRQAGGGGGELGGGREGGGGLGDILGGALGGALGGGGRGGGGGGGLGDVLGGMLGGGTGGAGGAGGIDLGGLGGLGGLLEQFQRAGLGQQAQSWVSTGENQPLSPDAVEKVFGPGALDEIARRSGLSTTEASQGLAQLLPEVVDRVTPDGTLPDDDSLQASVAAMIAHMNPGDDPRTGS
jgi:uncharacterized protein YidB (DUF937 family)